MYEWGALPIEEIEENKEKVDDRFEEFYKSYLSNIRPVSAVTMLRTDGEIDEDLLSSNICWMVSFNMIEMLADGSIIDQFNKEVSGQYESLGDVKNLAEFVYNHLYKNNLLAVSTGGIVDGKFAGGDHHSIVIGSNGLAYLIEWGSDKCQAYKIFTIDEYVLYIIGVRLGKVPELHYKKMQPTVISINAYNRIPMNSQVVIDYVSEYIDKLNE